VLVLIERSHAREDSQAGISLQARVKPANSVPCNVPEHSTPRNNIKLRLRIEWQEGIGQARGWLSTAGSAI